MLLISGTASKTGIKKRIERFMACIFIELILQTNRKCRRESRKLGGIGYGME
jgi:hypothetical protein